MKISGILIALVLLFTPSLSHSLEANVDYIPARSYSDILLKEINQAKESIKVYMFVVTARTDEQNSGVMKLLDALVTAKERGVDVEVHLDQNIPYGSFNPGTVRTGTEGKNKPAHEYLSSHGVTVLFDSVVNYAHGKAVIIDGKKTIFGSTNWSYSAFQRNSEINAIVESETFADQVLSSLSEVYDVVPEPAQAVRIIRVPRVFLDREDLLGRMVTKSDEWTLDTYLYLLKEYDGNPEGRVTVNFDNLAASVGIADRVRYDYRRQLVKNLKSLQNDYNLITIEKRTFSKPAEIILKDINNSESPYKVPSKDYIEIPETYWLYGWDSRLTLKGKTMFLLNQLYSKAGEQVSSWHQDRKALQARHHVGSTTLSFGTLELEQWNLIDVLYKRTSDDPNNPKAIAIYSPNEIYDLNELEGRFKELEAQYGRESIARVRKYAEVIYRENNYEDILTLLELDAKYSQAIMEEAVKIVGDKKRSNPKRTMGYLIGTIRRMTEQEEVL